MRDKQIRELLTWLCSLVTAFLFLLFFSTTLSPLYGVEIDDSSVYKLMGLSILHGKIPYTDILDHKGPMLYAIQALGQWLIPGRNGLFILAVVSLTVTVALWYKSARIFTTSKKSIVVCLLTFLTYYLYHDTGNLTEDWSLLFISPVYYLILSILFKDKQLPYLFSGGIIGLCLACSFFIRPNDAVAFIGAPILGVLVWLWKEKAYKDIVRWLIGIVSGFLVVTLLFVTWFAVYGSIEDLWYGLVGFNSKYSDGVLGMLKGGFKIVKLKYLPFIITLLVLGWNSPARRILYVLIPSSIAAYFLTGSASFLHYYIAWLPVLFFSFWLLSVLQTNKIIIVLAACVFLSLPIFYVTNWLKLPMRAYYEIKRDRSLTDTVCVNTKLLFEGMDSQDKDSIWSYNLTWHSDGAEPINTFNILLYNDIIPSNRVPLIFMADVDSALRKDMNIQESGPKYILLSRQNTLPESYTLCDSTYIEDNYYIKGSCEHPKVILYERIEKSE